MARRRKRIPPENWDGVSYKQTLKQGRAETCVKFVTCPSCKAKPGKLCQGTRGVMWDVHYLRRYAYHIYRMMELGRPWPLPKQQAIEMAGGPMPKPPKRSR